MVTAALVSEHNGIRTAQNIIIKAWFNCLDPHIGLERDLGFCDQDAHSRPSKMTPNSLANTLNIELGHN